MAQRMMQDGHVFDYNYPFFNPAPIPDGPPKPKPSHMTALVLVPDESLWEPLQAIRRVHDSKHVDRWPPHVTLVYPFVPVCR